MAFSSSGFRGTRAGVTTETRPVFIKLPEEQIPPVWDCRHCGRPASRHPGAVPGQLAAEDPEGYKSHLDYLKKDDPARTPKMSWPER